MSCFLWIETTVVITVNCPMWSGSNVIEISETLLARRRLVTSYLQFENKRHRIKNQQAKKVWHQQLSSPKTMHIDRILRQFRFTSSLFHEEFDTIGQIRNENEENIFQFKSEGAEICCIVIHESMLLTNS